MRYVMKMKCLSMKCNDSVLMNLNIKDLFDTYPSHQKQALSKSIGPVFVKVAKMKKITKKKLLVYVFPKEKNIYTII